MAPFSFLGEPLKSPVNAEKKSKLWFKKKTQNILIIQTQ